MMRRAGFMTLLNGANRDYGHILCERPCAFGKAHHRALAKRQSKRPNLGKRAYVGKPRACSLLDFYRIKDAVVLYENVNLGTGFISIEPKTGFPATVPASFEQFADDMGFEHRAAHEILGTGHAPMMPAFAALRFGKPEGEADGGPPLLKLRRTGVVQAMSGEAPR